MHRASGAGEQTDGAPDVERVLAELDADELALDAPPPDVWLGIAAAVAAERVVSPVGPRTAPAIAEPPAEVVEYLIDGDDVVVQTDAAWAAAARAAGAPELKSAPADRTLWDAMGDAETRELWQLVVDRVRTTGEAMSLPIRCDSPDARRWFEMTVTLGPDRHVHFRCALQFEESRSRVDLLDPSVTSSSGAEPLKVCGWCGRGGDGDTWYELDELLRRSRALEAVATPPLSFGVCGDCRDELALSLAAQSNRA